MEIVKKNREGLKTYFKKNSIPTESNFAELIDVMLNQKDDGIFKTPETPLCIEASGDDKTLQKVLNLYGRFGDPKTSWVINLNLPSSVPGKSARPCFNISDGAEKTRLFIDGSTGYIGIGTKSPDSTLTVNTKIKYAKDYAYGDAPLTIFESEDNGGNTSKATRDILHLVREGVDLQAYGNKVSLALGRYKDDLDLTSMDSHTQLDIKLTDGSFDKHQSVMSLRSNGNVGIGTTNPEALLEVSGTVMAKEFRTTLYSEQLSRLSIGIPVLRTSLGTTSSWKQGLPTPDRRSNQDLTGKDLPHVYYFDKMFSLQQGTVVLVYYQLTVTRSGGLDSFSSKLLVDEIMRCESKSSAKDSWPSGVWIGKLEKGDHTIKVRVEALSGWNLQKGDMYILVFGSY